MVDETNIKKQREIGKQLLLVDIIHAENDKVMKGSFSRLSSNDLVRWTSMTNEEVDHFIEVCSVLDPWNMAKAAAKKYRTESTFGVDTIVYGFVLSTYYRMGNLFVQSVKLDRFGYFCEKFSELNYEEYCEICKDFPVDESYASSEFFEEAMRFYIRYFVSVIKEVISEGYDWDVIVSMTRTDITEDRYQRLVKEV